MVWADKNSFCETIEPDSDNQNIEMCNAVGYKWALYIEERWHSGTPQCVGNEANEYSIQCRPHSSIDENDIQCDSNSAEICCQSGDPLCQNPNIWVCYEYNYYY